jgi:hypothetical protein
MIVTETFAGKLIGSYKYLFFALYDDFNDFDRAFIREFNEVYLRRLARNLKGRGAVIQPFLGDIEKTRADIESKEWTEKEYSQLSQFPALLVISKDFNSFSPRSDPWVIFHFGEGRFGGPEGFEKLDKTLKAIARSVTDSNTSHQDLYEIARTMTNERPDLGLVFSLQPNIFGFSIDIMKAGSYLSALIEGRRRPVGRRSGSRKEISSGAPGQAEAESLTLSSDPELIRRTRSRVGSMSYFQSNRRGSSCSGTGSGNPCSLISGTHEGTPLSSGRSAAQSVAAPCSNHPELPRSAAGQRTDKSHVRNHAVHIALNF